MVWLQQRVYPLFVKAQYVVWSTIASILRQEDFTYTGSDPDQFCGRESWMVCIADHLSSSSSHYLCYLQSILRFKSSVTLLKDMALFDMG